MTERQRESGFEVGVCPNRIRSTFIAEVFSEPHQRDQRQLYKVNPRTAFGVHWSASGCRYQKDQHRTAQQEGAVPCLEERLGPAGSIFRPEMGMTVL